MKNSPRAPIDLGVALHKLTPGVLSESVVIKLITNISQQTIIILS